MLATDVLGTWVLEWLVDGGTAYATWWRRSTSHNHELAEKCRDRYLAFLIGSRLEFSACKCRRCLDFTISHDTVSIHDGHI